MGTCLNCLSDAVQISTCTYNMFPWNQIEIYPKNIQAALPISSYWKQLYKHSVLALQWQENAYAGTIFDKNKIQCTLAPVYILNNSGHIIIVE